MRVSAEFSVSLATLPCVVFGEGSSVIYKPREAPPSGLERFSGGYVGRIVSSAAHIRVRCPDGIEREFSPEELFLEAKLDVIHDYGRSMHMTDIGQMFWRAVHQLNHVMTPAGRRNQTVLKDRLEAIRRFLGPHRRSQLEISLASYSTGSVLVDLTPIEIALTQS
nr:MAG: hypothetical protein DIU57_20670 [Pseudomonadota bacterium]